MTTTDQDPILTVEDVAARLRIKASAARKMIARERKILRPARIGRRTYIRESDLARLLDARRASA